MKMKNEMRDIRRGAVKEGEAPAGGLGAEIAQLFSKGGLKSDVVELRGHEIKPLSFEKGSHRSMRTPRRGRRS